MESQVGKKMFVVLGEIYIVIGARTVVNFFVKKEVPIAVDVIGQTAWFWQGFWQMVNQ